MKLHQKKHPTAAKSYLRCIQQTAATLISLDGLKPAEFNNMISIIEHSAEGIKGTLKARAG